MGTEGRLWGTLTIGTSQDEPLPPDTEARLGEFTELMATAIANGGARGGGAARRGAGRAAAGGDAGRRGRLADRGFRAVAAEMEGLLEPTA